MNNDNTVRAGEYVLGVLDAEERAALERDAASDRELADEIAFWQARFMPLLDTVGVEPPADLFGRIKSAIAAEAADLPGTITVRAGEGGWQTVARGVERKVLYRTEERVTYLIRGQPGARQPGHAHDDDEEIYLLQGDLTMGTLTLRAGDFHLARRGVQHPTATTAEGCMLLVSAAA
ncbi:MAG: cupin domain-containing protein [Xanthobacteraceae bacterium]